MRTILALDDNKRWVLLQTQADVDHETALSETAVKLYFQRDQILFADGRANEAPCYYSLRKGEGNAEVSLVTGRVAPAPEDQDPTAGSQKELMFVGKRNTDPFVRHAASIEALANAIGMAIPLSAYPYSRDVGGLGHASWTDENEDKTDEPLGPQFG